MNSSSVLASPPRYHPNPDDLPEDLKAELWRRGELRWKLRDYQQEFYDAVWTFLLDPKPSSLKFFIDNHRRYGKSFVLFLIAIEVGLGKKCREWPTKNRVIRLAAPTMLDLEEIYHPMADDLFEDCPDDIRPTWQQTRGRGHYCCPSTNAKVYLFGVDAKHYKKGRGKKCHLALVDEAGACDPGCTGGIDHVVNSILMPQTFSIGGRVVIATTPPETPGHHSHSLKSQCQAAGTYFKRTLDQNRAYFGESVVADYERECGGRETTAFRREYLCQWIVDAERAVIPEFDEHESVVVCPVDPPTHEQPTIAIDVGFEDLTAILFGYWCFTTARLHIQAEVTIKRGRTDQVADAIAGMEAKLWKENQNLKKPIRWSDVDLRLIADLGEIHNLGVMATAKDDKEAQVNALRMLFKDERIRIDPSCTMLIGTLKTAVWNKGRTSFERLREYGHADALDALIYLYRNVDRYSNPYPGIPEGATWQTHQLRNIKKPAHEEAESIKRLMGAARRS
jgi:hypothetical protein